MHSVADVVAADGEIAGYGTNSDAATQMYYQGNSRLGAKVTVVELMPGILPGNDDDIVADAMCDPQMYSAGGFSSDGFHPNDAGYAYLAQRLLTIFNAGSSSVAGSCAQMTVVPAL